MRVESHWKRYFEIISLKFMFLLEDSKGSILKPSIKMLHVFITVAVMYPGGKDSLSRVSRIFAFFFSGFKTSLLGAPKAWVCLRRKRAMPEVGGGSE